MRGHSETQTVKVPATDPTPPGTYQPQQLTSQSTSTPTVAGPPPEGPPFSTGTCLRLRYGEKIYQPVFQLTSFDVNGVSPGDVVITDGKHSMIAVPPNNQRARKLRLGCYVRLFGQRDGQSARMGTLISPVQASNKDCHAALAKLQT